MFSTWGHCALTSSEQNLQKRQPDPTLDPCCLRFSLVFSALPRNKMNCEIFKVYTRRYFDVRTLVKRCRPHGLREHIPHLAGLPFGFFLGENISILLS